MVLDNLPRTAGTTGRDLICDPVPGGGLLCRGLAQWRSPRSLRHFPGFSRCTDGQGTLPVCPEDTEGPADSRSTGRRQRRTGRPLTSLQVARKGSESVSELRRLPSGAPRRANLLARAVLRAAVRGDVAPPEPRMQRGSVRRGFPRPLYLAGSRCGSTPDWRRQKGAPGPLWTPNLPNRNSGIKPARSASESGRRNSLDRCSSTLRETRLDIPSPPSGDHP